MNDHSEQGEAFSSPSDERPVADQSVVIKPISEILASWGFKRMGKRKWYRETAEIGQLIELYRFRYNPRYRLEISGRPLGLNVPPPPGYTGYSFGPRLEDTRDDRTEFMRALNLEEVFSPEAERAAIIKKVLTGPVDECLKKFGTIEDILRAWRRDKYSGEIHISPYILPHLGEEPPPFLRGWNPSQGSSL